MSTKIANTPIRECYPEPTDPQPSPQTSLRGHLGLVARVEQASIDPPPQWRAIHERFGVLQETVTGHSPVLLQRLIDAVVDGPPGDIPTRLAAASVAIDPNVVEACHTRVHGALMAAYAPAARRNYGLLAARFDEAAQRLTKLAGTVDVEAPADEVVGDKRRSAAWTEAPQVAARLDEILPSLAAAALLCRRIDQPARLGSDPATFELSLTVDPGRSHARRLWLAWHEQREVQPPTDALTLSHLTRPAVVRATSRCGRWGSVLAVGGHLGAHPRPELLELLPPPANRVIQTSDGAGRRINQVVVDPADAPSQGRLRRLVGALSGRHTPPDADILDTVADAVPEGAHHED